MAKTNKKDKGGRPTSYKKAYVKQTLDYIRETQIPYIEELAEKFEVHEDTINNWVKKTVTKKGKQVKAYPEFFGAIKRLKQKQKLMLQKLGLSSKINSTMAIFQLKVNHGFVETQHIDHTTKGNKLPETNITLSSLNDMSEKDLLKAASNQNRRNSDV